MRGTNAECAAFVCCCRRFTASATVIARSPQLVPAGRGRPRRAEEALQYRQVADRWTKGMAK